MKIKKRFFKNQSDRMPFIDITLRNDGKEVNYRALVDSGAWSNMFPADLLVILGLNYNSLQKGKFGGATDIRPEVEYGKSILEIEFEGYKFDAQVGFSTNMSKNGYGFVGRFGFFDHFKIAFDYPNDNMWFTPSKGAIFK